MLNHWFVWHRQWGRYKVACCVTSWAFGSGYKYARNNYGFVRYFWTKRKAQTFANELNGKNLNGGCHP